MKIDYFLKIILSVEIIECTARYPATRGPGQGWPPPKLEKSEKSCNFKGGEGGATPIFWNLCKV